MESDNERLEWRPSLPESIRREDTEKDLLKFAEGQIITELLMLKKRRVWLFQFARKFFEDGIMQGIEKYAEKYPDSDLASSLKNMLIG